MDDTVATYTFDLKAEVENALRFYPAIADKLFFVGLKAQSTNDPAFECYGPAWAKHKDDAAKLAFLKKELLFVLNARSSCAVRNSHFPDMQFVIIYFPREGRAAHDFAFAFDHELGHQLVPSGFVSGDDRLAAENAADAFAALRCLQRFGREKGLQYISDRSCLRLVQPLTNVREDLDHLTGPTLLQIIEDAAKRSFENLSPDETVAMADEYAMRCSPSAAGARQQWQTLHELVHPAVTTFVHDAPHNGHHTIPMATASPVKNFLHTWATRLGITPLHGDGGQWADKTVKPGDPGSWGHAHREEKCPCGSGQQYKNCHGALALH